MAKESPFLRESLRLAAQAARKNEVPIGAVVVLGDKVIGRGYNQTRRLKNVFAHAEILALKKAQKRLGDFRLAGAKLYVTLEPCLMCLGAALLSRIKEIHYILPEPTFGSFRSVLGKKHKGSYRGLKFFRHQQFVPATKTMLRDFFAGLRNPAIRRRGR